MKAKDIMIGDWVANENERLQVYSIGQNSVVFPDKSVAHQDFLQPIPLTAEILEKNEFEKKTFYGIYDDYFDLDIREYSDGLYIVTYHSCEFNIPDQTIHLSWVHELQHFMRHCGIDKEIVL